MSALNKSVGYIDADGEYHPGIEGPIMMGPASSQFKAWDHDRQRAEHAADLLQPYDRNGKPNTKFLEMYPDESKINGMEWKDRNEI